MILPMTNTLPARPMHALISTRLQPGGRAERSAKPFQRFGVGAVGRKPLKRFPSWALGRTRLKPGANERAKQHLAAGGCASDFSSPFPLTPALSRREREGRIPLSTDWDATALRALTAFPPLHEPVPAVCNRRPWDSAVRGGIELSTRNTAIVNRRHEPIRTWASALQLS